MKPFDLQLFAEGDEPTDAPTDAPLSTVVDDVHATVTALAERVSALESKVTAAPIEAVHEDAPALEPTIEEPPALVVESTIERSGLRRFHDALG